MQSDPVIIQGGMGAGVSSWRLAQAVSRQGQLGVVSGTALDQIFVRRLQDGDPGGHMRRSLDAFPFPAMAERIWSAYYIPGGKAANAAYRITPMHAHQEPRELTELCIVSNFVEIWLAGEGHANPVGINYLEKIQVPHLSSMYGAMLAGVGYVIMGAGIPLHVPGVLDTLARHEPAEYALHVIGAREGDDTAMRFDPRAFMECELPPLDRPKFLAIVSSNTLAATMLRKANGKVDGLIIETRIAGGHNAPPRGKLQLDAQGEPIYGERDAVDFAKIRELGAPFWLAGGYGWPDKVREALAVGATGVQVGTAFAFTRESALREDLKQALLDQACNQTARIFTDPFASPSGFPFKVARLEGTASEEDVCTARPRICDLGFLREAYRGDDGQVAYRCPAEPLSIFLSKGGKAEDAVGRKCLCNGLMANIGHQQVRCGHRVEPALVTAGDDLVGVARFLPAGATSYGAADVLAMLLPVEGIAADTESTASVSIARA
ncbi:MAG TPA: nitronate monooxygenase [Acidobacteriaceae bacterium]|jgi:nitronate monooxygenase|nr:nitronate monooxygenase [Acidobacteriaceae bacterium]